MHIPTLRLHHYTSGNGLLGIVQSGSIWATQIQYMNDSKEFSHAIELAKTLIRERRATPSGDRFVGFCDALANHLQRISGLAFYVACFSEAGDSISQWRGYCPTGFGYSICFDGEQLEEVATSQGFSLRRCIYDPREQHLAVSRWVDSTLAQLMNACPLSEDPRSFCEKMADTFLTEFVEFAPYMKDHAFADEREWRLASLIPTTDARLQLRPGKSMLVPYAPIDLRLAPHSTLLWNILVGPTPHFDLAMNSASQLLQKKQLMSAVGRSIVPYRDW